MPFYLVCTKKHIFLLINDLDYPHHACRTSQNPPNLPNWPESSHCLLTKNDWILNRILLCQILEQIFCFGASFMTDSNVTLTDSIFEIGKAYVCGPREHPMSLVHTQGPKVPEKFETVYLFFTTSSYFCMGWGIKEIKMSSK
jgi:hypothetical protein